MTATPPFFWDTKGGVQLRVRVQPRAHRSAIVGRRGDALRISISAPPVDDRANEALVDLLAADLGVARRLVRIVSGASAHIKIVEIETMSAADLSARRWDAD